MSKITVNKDLITSETDNTVVNIQPTIVTGEIILDEHNRILEIKHD